MSYSPRISVIIPVYNGERYLIEAIESVLSQTYPAAEVIVVDDGSTDRSGAIAQSFGPRVQYEYQAHRPIGGAAAARNRGVELTHGELVAFLDADDRWTADKLERQVAAIAAGPNERMIFGHVRQFISAELGDALDEAIASAETLSGISVATLLIGRAAFQAIGPFESRWQVGEFMDWYLRATERGLETVVLPEVVLERRVHTTNQGVHKRHLRGDYVRIVKAALDRRRQPGRSAPTSAPDSGRDPF